MSQQSWVVYSNFFKCIVDTQHYVSFRGTARSQQVGFH